LQERDWSTILYIATFNPSFRSAYSYHYNLTIQRELPAALLLEVSYVGNNSFKLDQQRELNPLIADPESPGNTKRTYPGLFSIRSQESSGRARYDSLQTRLSRRFKSGFSLDGYYVFSKVLDNASGPKTSLTRRATAPKRGAIKRIQIKTG
jgi:hypothetical protein